MIEETVDFLLCLDEDFKPNSMGKGFIRRVPSLLSSLFLSLSLSLSFFFAMCDCVTCMSKSIWNWNIINIIIYGRR